MAELNEGESAAQSCAKQEFTYRNVELFKSEILGSGTGSHGSVCKAKCDELICAAKIFKKENSFTQFESQCRFLLCINHPNIITYLKSYQCPETNSPVLLMELMDESLTHFLESSPGDIPYHIQVNLSYDIAQALAFLHANGIVHRDLSSNNVLLIAGSRAKVTDFGMDRYTDMSDSLTKASVYMPPEIFKEPPEYTAKLDVFSYGVMLVQLLTRESPQPTDRCKKQGIGRKKKQTVSEIERRQAHISVIDHSHPLRTVALKCLQDEHTARPFSQHLCQETYSLKERTQYTDSIESSLTASSTSASADPEELRAKRKKGSNKRRAKSGKNLLAIVGLLGKGKENEEVSKQSEPITSQEQDINSTDGQTQLFKWEMLGEAPRDFQAGSLAVINDKIYLRSSGSENIHVFNPIKKPPLWSKLPAPPTKSFTIVAVNGEITTVGGSDDSLYCRTLEDDNWKESFVPMPTKRKTPAAVCSKNFLVVAGGSDEDRLPIDIVEILNTSERRWSQVSSLPFPTNQSSMVVCNDTIYISAGNLDLPKPTIDFKSVLHCSFEALVCSTQDTKSPVWEHATSTPVCSYTLVSDNNTLFAIGGKDSDNRPVRDVYKYRLDSNTWQKISEMCEARSECLAAVLPGNKFIVVGDLGPYSKLAETCTIPEHIPL